MDFVTEISANILPAVERSPFWRKTYGGYTTGQIEFAVRQLKPRSRERVYDPMSGQSFSLCQLSWHGAKVHLSDINPGALALASLRDPDLIINAQSLSSELRVKFRRVREHKIARKAEFCQDWLSPKIASELKDTFEQLRIEFASSPFDKGVGFWRQQPLSRLAVGIAVLAARSISSFRSTDNQTWLRKGGVTPALAVREAMLQALESWMSFASDARTKIERRGSLSLATWNVESGVVKNFGAMDAIIVSPPYANRLDYSSLWAPETAVLASLFSHDSDHLKRDQVGSTVVKNKRPNEHDVHTLPEIIVQSLETIRSNSAHASDSYYYPFFANYALSLMRSIKSWAGLLKKNGRLIVFVRDTVRKDHLFPTDKLVSEVASRAGLSMIQEEPKLQIIRSHIGLLRRKRSGSGVHGLAQQEWWLSFQKR